MDNKLYWILKNLSETFRDKNTVFKVIDYYLLACQPIERIRLYSYCEEDGKYFLTFFPAGKDSFNLKNLQKGKIGKVLKTLAKDYFPDVIIPDEECEKAVNLIKAAISGEGCEFKLVSGDDIKKFYHVDNYVKGGATLNASCMRYPDCQKYFDIYCDNPDCEMLIMFDNSVSNDKIVGRALVWNYNGQKYVDRRYYSSDYYHDIMIDYIESQKWNFKSNNTYEDYYNKDFYVYENGEYEERSVEIEFDWYQKNGKTSYKYYPYCDTFKYFNNGVLSNYDDDSDSLELTNTDGGVENHICCSCCGDSLDDYDAIYSNLTNQYYCSYCCIWSNYHDEYIPRDEAIEVIFEDGTEYILPEYFYGSTEIIDGKIYALNDDYAGAYDVNDLDEDEIESKLEDGFKFSFDHNYLIVK